MAANAMRRNFDALGFDVEGDGLDWTLVPRTQWMDRGSEPRPDGLEAPDAENVRIEVTVGNLVRNAGAVHTTRDMYHVETYASAPFVVPVRPADELAVEVRARVVDGRGVAKLQWVACKGAFRPPEKHDHAGTPVTTVALPFGIIHLHEAIVGGERSYVHFFAVLNLGEGERAL